MWLALQTALQSIHGDTILSLDASAHITDTWATYAVHTGCQTELQGRRLPCRV